MKRKRRKQFTLLPAFIYFRKEETIVVKQFEGDRFSFPKRRQRYTGLADQTVRFLESDALCDRVLWKKFVNQFREQLDGSNQGWRGEYWGKMMRGAVLAYEYSQNQELYQCLTETVLDMLTVAEEDGRVSSYSRDSEFDSWDLWCRKYVFLGMEYYYDICLDEDLKDHIVRFCCNAADCILNKIGSDKEKKEITKASRSWYGVNSSSILEPMVWLYRLTEQTRYFDFATYIIENGGADGINIFELALENKLYPYQYGVSKAYEMISCFEGLLEYYRITGIEKYRTMVINFGRAVMETEVSVIGSCGCTHELFDHTVTRQTAAYDGVQQETCVTVTWMKFCSQLLRLTGDPAFADCMERSFYNAYLGSLNVEHKICDYIREKFEKQKSMTVVDTFLPFDSYSPLRPGKRGEKVGGNQLLSDGSYYGCCACIGAAGVGVFLRHMVMTDSEGIVLNFLENGETSVSYKEKNVCLTVETAYPADGKIRIRVSTAEPMFFSLKIRVPAWSTNTSIQPNHHTLTFEDGYAVLTGEWKTGDEIVVCYDMALLATFPQAWDTDTVYTDMSHLRQGYHCADPVTVVHDEKDDHFVSFSRGPLTLCADSRMGKNASSVFSLCHSDGTVRFRVCEDKDIVPGKPCVLHCEFTDTEGKTVHLIDYASAGRDWKTVIAAWLPTE